ncbi:MAG: hypothetical protein EB084_19460 [Proteobacteria bacterium]|nr:hypothetical protein [Pseudomonadota bacterium]
MIEFPRISAVKTQPLSAPPATPETTPEAKTDVDFSYNAQDVMVMPSKAENIKGVSGGKRPQTDKVVLASDLTPVNGKYVYGDGDQANNAAAISFAAAAKTVAAFEKALGQPIEWAFGDQRLSVTPDEGENFNAYYSRWSGGVHFFHGTDNVIGATMMSGASGEVVSHECGHAMLDALRPGYLSTWSADPGGFHESFGDQLGMLMAFQDERTLQRVAVQTGGDLRKPNILAATGEQLGIGINDFKGTNRTGGDWVRNANNTFTWVDPSTLPGSAPSDQLSSEVHSYSRLWTGAFYDVVCAVQASNMAKGMAPVDALRATGAEMLSQVANLMKTAPQGDFTYRDMANAWIAADQQFNNGARADLIRDVMTKRLILSAGEPAPAPATPAPPSPSGEGLSKAVDQSPTRTVAFELKGDRFGMFEGARVETVVDRDGSLSKDAETINRTKSNIERLIKDGRIRYNDPGYQMKTSDWFDSKGQPYIGAVRWENGQMLIERSKITS